jgi:crotonobetainyl-CoA:carnitine CoA-transferase CaiB-like acyl-CoA transferase
MRAGHDINYLSRAGITYAAGRKEGGPSLYNFQIADVAGGSMNAVASILAAIIHREKTGEGQFLDVSMQDSVLPFNTMDGAAYFAGGPVPTRESGYLNGGEIYDFYETSDGAYMSVGSLEPKFFADLCKGLGYPEWQDGAILKTDVAMVKETFRAKFKTRTRAEWTAIFQQLDACVEPVMSLEEVAADEHLHSRGMWPTLEVPVSDGVTITQMGCPLNLSACPPEYRHAGFPEGYHTREVLAELGYSQDEIEDMV